MMSKQFRTLILLMTLLTSILAGLLSPTFDAQAAVRAASPSEPDGPDEWPTLGHDLGRSGASSEQVANPTGSNMPILWVRDFASADNPDPELINTGVQPILALGSLFIPTLRNRLYALDPESGQTRWAFHPGRPGAMLASPSVALNSVFVGSTDGFLYALNPATGSLRWSFQAGRGGFAASPAVHNNTVFIGSRDGSFYALDAASGATRWSFPAGAPILASPTLDTNSNRLFFAAENMRVYALNASTGSLLWRSRQLPGRSFAPYYPVLAGDTLFIRSNPAAVASTILEQGDQVILSAAGVSNNASPRAVCSEESINIRAPFSQSAFQAELDAIRSFLSSHPEYQSWFALRTDNGLDRYSQPLPILWSAGSGHAGPPPVLQDPDHLIALVRSYYSNFDMCDVWYLFGGFASLQVSTGQLSLLNFANEPSSSLWSFGIGVIGDEQNTPSLGGSTLFVTSHADTVGGFNLASRSGVRGITSRDQPWFYSPRNLPFMGEVSSRLHELPSPREGASAVVPFNQRLYWVAMSTVGALAQPGTGGGWSVPPITNPQSNPPRSVSAPPLDQLRPFVLNLPPASTDPNPALRAELEAQVADLIATRYAPLLFTPGKVVNQFYFQDPADTFYSLAIALPYLSPSLQSQVRAFLASEWQQANPLSTSRYALNSGSRREPFAIGPDALNAAFSSGTATTPARVEMLYAVWAFAHYADQWDLVQPHWNSIKSMVTSTINPADPATLLSSPSSSATGSLNRRTSALIAYTRLAQHFGDTNAYNWGLDAATRSLAARINYEQSYRPTLGTWHTGNASGGRFVLRSGSHRTWIPRYRDLTPEIGAALRTYAAPDLSDQAAYLRSVRPSWYVAWGPHVFEGEVSSSFPQHAIDIFNAQAMMLGASPAELALYLDQPWCRGDLFFIQKLVYTLRSGANPALPSSKRVSQPIAGYGDVLRYTVTLGGSGGSVSLVDALPSTLALVPGSLSCSPAGVGMLDSNEREIRWSGTLAQGASVELRYSAVVQATVPGTIRNRAVVSDAVRGTYTLETTTTVVGRNRTYLPLAMKQMK